MRFPAGLLSAVLVALGLFWLMHWLIAPPEGRAEPPPDKAKIKVAHMQEPPEPEQSQSDNGGGGSSAPPEPPPTPGLSRPTGVEVPAPEADSDVVMPDVDVQPELSNSTGMGQSFAGFAGGGSGSGAGGGSGSGFGPGSGAGSGGPDLVPLSTSRPQIPKRACEQGIEGWATVQFTVTSGGKVTNVQVVDAQPRGVFERAMVRSVEDWLYKANDEDQAHKVRWKFEFKLEDCKLNWDTS